MRLALVVLLRSGSSAHRRDSEVEVKRAGDTVQRVAEVLAVFGLVSSVLACSNFCSVSNRYRKDLKVFFGIERLLSTFHPSSAPSNMADKIQLVRPIRFISPSPVTHVLDILC